VNSITSDLALKEDISNKVKSIDISNITDETKYPTTKAVNDFVLSGDLTGVNGLPSVNTVGGVLSSTIKDVVTLVQAGTSSNTAYALVKRDDSGNFIRDDCDYVENISYNINYESQKPKIIHLLKDHIEIRGIV
jgi:hypothetical protein